MIYLYLFSLVLGGHGDAHHEVHVGHVGAGNADGHDTVGGFEGFLVAFLSMRFWTFFLAFFGLTGVVLDGLGLVGSSAVSGVLSVGMGLGAGLGAVWLMRRIRADDSNSAAMSKDYVGKSGRVLVGFGPGQTGKVRVEVRGSSIDLLAAPIGGETFATKEEIIVVEMDGNRAKVARMDPERLSKP